MANPPTHTVWIPSLYRDLTGGAESVEVSADNVGDVIDKLEKQYPGIADRLCEDGRIRPHIAVSIDGEVTNRGRRQKLPEPSEIHFIPALSGG